MKKGYQNIMAKNRKIVQITAEDIQRRLGFSTIPMGSERFGAKEIAMIREAGITRIEICGWHFPSHYDYHDTVQVSEITSECRKQGISIVSVHGPNSGLPYSIPYEEVRRAVVKELAFSARIAEKMGATIFVTHFGTDVYSERSINEMLEQLHGSAIKITIENGNDLKVYADFVDRIGSDRFGMVVDIGHTVDSDGINPFIKKERAYEVMLICKHRLFHLHLHDFADRDHCPPFDGKIQWGEIFSALQDTGYKGEFMFEAIARVSVEDTLKKTADFPKEFVKRYGR